MKAKLPSSLLVLSALAQDISGLLARHVGVAGEQFSKLLQRLGVADVECVSEAYG
jgi:hypothetical protein